LAGCDEAPKNATPPVLASNTLTIQDGGDKILWNGAKVDFDTFKRLCKETVHGMPRPDIRVEPENFAESFSNMQKSGCTTLAFTGIDQYK